MSLTYFHDFSEDEPSENTACVRCGHVFLSWQEAHCPSCRVGKVAPADFTDPVRRARAEAYDARVTAEFDEISARRERARGCAQRALALMAQHPYPKMRLRSALEAACTRPELAVMAWDTPPLNYSANKTLAIAEHALRTAGDFVGERYSLFLKDDALPIAEAREMIARAIPLCLTV